VSEAIDLHVDAADVDVDSPTLHTRAEWDAAYINDLPDSAFAVILPGGSKDEDGRTTPRDLRKLPHHNAAGDIDMPHLRNALSREPQADMPESAHSMAQAHLAAHMDGQQDRAIEDVDHDLHELTFDADVHIRSEAKREIALKLVPWGVTRVGRAGPERMERGAFEGIDPSNIVLQLEHLDPPAGKGIALEERSDAPYAIFKVANTQRGDEILELAKEGITRGASVSYYDVPGGTEIAYEGGRRTRVVRKANLVAVSTTWRPTWEQSAVLYVRSKPQEGQVAEETSEKAPASPAPAAPVQIDLGPLADAMKSQTELQQRSFDAFAERIAKLEEQDRGDITLPVKHLEPKKPKLAEWSSVALRMMTAQPVSQKELHERALDDIVTPDNPGLVPDALRSDLLVGIINRRRPFLESTTQIVAPETGMSIVVPVLSSRSEVDVQSTEKSDIASNPLKVTTSSFDAVTIAGGADVSIQMIRRADPSFMDLLIRDLGHAYARKAEDEALDALFAAGTTPGTGNLDPEDLTIGEAWENSMTATDEPPDTIWLSAAGVSAFINAKNDGTNAPLYFRLNAAFAVGTGTGGDVSALRPVYVPALDGSSVDVMIGPSSGFAWAEDGAIRLETDVPAKAGRDIALVGIFFFVPRYPAAFTTYDLGS
jgi:phage head maturation protease